MSLTKEKALLIYTPSKKSTPENNGHDLT